MNLKLNLKVLNEMDADFIYLEGTLLQVQDQERREALFREIRQYREWIGKLKEHYHKRLLQKPNG